MKNGNKKSVLNLLDELRGLAQIGLNYSKDPYDLQRYTRIMELVSMEYAELTGLASSEVRNRFAKELGYITPKIGVQGALFNEQGEVLLEKRKDDGLWGLPGGWVEVGETPEETIVREFKEETNITVLPEKVIGFYTRLPGEHNQPHTSLHILYFCTRQQGELKKSFESLEMTFQNPAEVSSWHKDHEQQVQKALHYYFNI
jgi:mutator protein MutT